jgi:uncharacterized RDD family membrane protein YckC
VARAGFWIRAAALAIDVGGVWLFAWGVTSLVLLLPLSWEDPAPWLANLPDTLFCAGLLTYGATEALWPATPGKRLLGLVIANPDGTPAERWRLFFRWSSKYYGVLVSLIWFLTLHPAARLLGGFMNLVLLVGFLYALNDDKRAWHDEWAGTAVYRRRRVAPPPLPYRGYHPRPPNGPITASA